MPNEYRSPAMKAGRVLFDLEAEAKKERAKMGGAAPPVQPPARTKAPKQMKAPAPTPTPGEPLNRGTKPSLKDTKKYAEELEKS